MSLLAPLFLVGLAGLAVPVFIHLIQREKKRVVQFPSLMFLAQIPYQSVRRRRIHNWTLLLLRLAALALVVLAFARPYFVRPVRAVTGTGAREVVILLDRSYSMGYGDRWTRARAAAKDVASGLTLSDRASLVLVDANAEVAVRSTEDKGRILAAIDAAQVSAGGTRFAPGLKVAGTILSESSLPRLEATLISDFQRSGWLGSDAVELPSTATLTPVSVDAPARTPNAGVAAVAIDRSTFEQQERITVTASITNFAASPLAAGKVALEIGGRAVQTATVDAAPGENASVTFQPVSVTGPNMRGTVRLGPDGLERDNVRHFVVSPVSAVPVVVVDRAPGTAASSLYFTRAAAIGERPSFAATVRAPDALPEEELRRAAVVVVNDVPVDSGLAGRLRTFVERGGGLLVFAGPRSAWPGSLSGAGGLLPAAIGAAADRSRGDAARLGAVEYGHPMFEAFRAARSGDFSAAQFFGFRSLTATADARVLARFDAGAPALVERATGKGRVMVWASSVDLEWNDLALKPVFLPFVHGALKHLAAYAAPPPFLTVGQVLDPGQLAGDISEPVALTPSGARVPLSGPAGQVLPVAEQGFYEVRGARAPGAASVIAANVDVTESDLTTIDPKELVAAVTVTGGAARPEHTGLPLPPEAQERGQRLWWLLLAGGLALFGAETILGNRLSKA
jgi:hypothetical protein